MNDSQRSRIQDTFARLVAATPDAAALIDAQSGLTVSRAGLASLAETIFGQLQANGIRPGDRVASRLPNSPDFIALFLATLRARAALVPLERESPDDEVRNLTDQLGIRHVVQFDAPGRLAVEVMSPNPGPDHHLPPTALIKLTSGSSGVARGILTSEENLIADAANICLTMKIGPEDRNFGAIPFSHSYGFSNIVTPLLLQGTAVIVSNDYLPLSILDFCNRFACSVLPGIPMMFEYLGRLPQSDGTFETVRTFVSAGAPLSADVSSRFSSRFGLDIHSFYGCSECGAIAYDREGRSVERGSVGSPVEGTRLSADAGDRLSVESAAVAIGYFDGSTLDRSRFQAGTFLTDDLGRIESGGELELIGRVTDTINTAGKKVNPREIEQLLLSVPGVREVRVYGEPAGARGDVVAAVIVGDDGLTRDQLRQYCRERLSIHKVPRIIKFVSAIPLDDRGKVKKSVLQAL